VSVTHRDSVVCVGGSDAGQHFATVFRLKWSNDGIRNEALPPLPIAVSGAAGALAGDTLFVACGAEKPGEQAATNRAFAMDLLSKEPAWRELPPLPGRGRLLPTGATRGELFYVFGGAALVPGAGGKVAREFLREAWCFEGGAWRRLADLPKPSVAAASPAPFVEGRFLLIGGDDGSQVGFQPAEKHPGFPRAILSYDSALDRWAETGEVPAPRATLPCVDWKNRLVFPSGEVRPGVRSPEVWSFLLR
jgi:N-acetylneuraminic acid mutarotase